jgi:hypothetical protein
MAGTVHTNFAMILADHEVEIDKVFGGYVTISVTTRKSKKLDSCKWLVELCLFAVVSIRRRHGAELLREHVFVVFGRNSGGEQRLTTPTHDRTLRRAVVG